MEDFLHLQLDINQKETYDLFTWLESMGLKPQWVEPEFLKSEDIKVCPMGQPDDQIHFSGYVY